MAELTSEFLFELRLAQPTDGVYEMGQTPNSRLRYSLASSGSFAGPKLNGIVLPNSGADWARVRGDMSISLDVRLCLQTEDKANIYLTYTGIMAAGNQTDLMYMVDSTKPDDPVGAESRYYFRSAMWFETGDGRYAWLNHLVAVGKGRLGDDSAIYDVFAIK